MRSRTTFPSISQQLRASLFSEYLSESNNLRITQRAGQSLQGAFRHAQELLVIPPVRIFYRAQNEVVYIVYVMRGERLFRNDNLLERDMV